MDEMKTNLYSLMKSQVSQQTSNQSSSHSPPELPPPSDGRTSRHTQTPAPQTPRQPHQRSTNRLPTKSQRPWKDGVFPPGPVRYLGPPMSRSTRSSSTSRARSSSMKMSRPPTSPASALSSTTVGATQSEYEVPQPIPSVPPPTAQNSAPPLITVVLDEDDDDDYRVPYPSPLLQPDRNSLNF